MLVTQSPSKICGLLSTRDLNQGHLHEETDSPRDNMDSLVGRVR